MANQVAEKIWARVTRAEQHIQDFKVGRDEFIKSRPYEIAVKESAESGNSSHYVSRIDAAPPALAAVAADAIQNLRSALDNLAYQLVLDARGGAKPSWNVYFPISKTLTDYLARRNGSLKGVRQEIIDAVDATEPYTKGKGHSLWQLQQLNNPDKHELLLDAGFYFRSLDVAPEMERAFRKIPGFENVRIPPIRLFPADKLNPLKVGDVVYEGPADPELATNGRLAFDLSIHGPSVLESEPADKSLNDLRNAVVDVIQKLEPFLP